MAIGSIEQQRQTYIANLHRIGVNPSTSGSRVTALTYFAPEGEFRTRELHKEGHNQIHSDHQEALEANANEVLYKQAENEVNFVDNVSLCGAVQAARKGNYWSATGRLGAAVVLASTAPAKLMGAAGRLLGTAGRAVAPAAAKAMAGLGLDTIEAVNGGRSLNKVKQLASAVRESRVGAGAAAGARQTGRAASYTYQAHTVKAGWDQAFKPSVGTNLDVRR